MKKQLFFKRYYFIIEISLVFKNYFLIFMREAQNITTFLNIVKRKVLIVFQGNQLIRLAYRLSPCKLASVR